MLEDWRSRLEAKKPNFNMGAARWGVLQMCIYDMWCTIEEARIWDIGLTETERLVHARSPALSAMIGQLRERLAGAFALTLSMSQRLQVEMQRWHMQWLDAQDSLRAADTARQSLQQRVMQLEERIRSLEEELSLHAAARQAVAGAPHPIESRFLLLQQDHAKLAQQLRAANSANASLRSREFRLRLSNEGLLDELSRWRARLGEGSHDEASPVKPEAPVAPGESSAAGHGTDALPTMDLQPLLALFGSYPPEAQRTALQSILHVHEALVAADPSLQTSHQPSASSPPAAEQSSSPPKAMDKGSVDGETRMAALQELATTLSEEEASALAKAIAARHAATQPSEVDATNAETAEVQPSAPLSTSEPATVQ